MKYVKINRVNLLYFIFCNVNGYFEEFNANKYLVLVPTNESKKIIKEYEELWSKIRDLIRSINKKWDNYDKDYMKIKHDLDDDLCLNKMIDIYIATIIVCAIFLENDIIKNNIIILH